MHEGHGGRLVLLLLLEVEWIGIVAGSLAIVDVIVLDVIPIIICTTA